VFGLGRSLLHPGRSPHRPVRSPLPPTPPLGPPECPPLSHGRRPRRSRAPEPGEPGWAFACARANAAAPSAVAICRSGIADPACAYGKGRFASRAIPSVTLVELVRTRARPIVNALTPSLSAPWLMTRRLRRSPPPTNSISGIPDAFHAIRPTRIRVRSVPHIINSITSVGGCPVTAGQTAGGGYERTVT